MSDREPRYAIYFAPPAASRLWQFGSSVLGYDAATGEDVAFPPELERGWPDWTRLTADPRKYGFHATLKAPFRLRDGADEANLLAAAQDFASATDGCALQGLAVAALGRFVALVPTGDIQPLQSFAKRVVNSFEPLRAPLAEADRARRLMAPLTAAQVRYLDTYGYPYVREEFRFHMTLTGSLPAELLEMTRATLAQMYAQACSAPVAIDSIAVFRQSDSGARFRIIARFPMR